MIHRARHRGRRAHNAIAPERPEAYGSQNMKAISSWVISLVAAAIISGAASAQQTNEEPGRGSSGQADKTKPHEGPWLFRQSDEEHLTGVGVHVHTVRIKTDLASLRARRLSPADPRLLAELIKLQAATATNPQAPDASRSSADAATELFKEPFRFRLERAIPSGGKPWLDAPLLPLTPNLR
jgi:hypothetical protein